MTLQSSTVEVKEVKSQLQALEIELQSQQSMVRSQEMSCSWAHRIFQLKTL